MTAIPAAENTATRQISDRSPVWEGSLGSGFGIGAGEHSPGGIGAATALTQGAPLPPDPHSVAFSAATSVTLRDRGPNWRA